MGFLPGCRDLGTPNRREKKEGGKLDIESPPALHSRKVWKCISDLPGVKTRLWVSSQGNSILHIMVKSMNSGFKCARFKS